MIKDPQRWGSDKVEVAGGVGEADAANVNPMGTPKRSMGMAEDAAGVDSAAGFGIDEWVVDAAEDAAGVRGTAAVTTIVVGA